MLLTKQNSFWCSVNQAYMLVQQLIHPHNIRGPESTYGLRTSDVVRMQLNRRHRLNHAWFLVHKLPPYLLLSMFAKCSFLMKYAKKPGKPIQFQGKLLRKPWISLDEQMPKSTCVRDQKRTICWRLTCGWWLRGVVRVTCGLRIHVPLIFINTNCVWSKLATHFNLLKHLVHVQGRIAKGDQEIFSRGEGSNLK